MGAQFLGIDGDVLTIKVSGRLERAELAEAQRLATDAIQKRGPVRILVLSEDFKGWAKDGDWGDLSFQIDNDAFIRKMAVVSDRDWKDLVLMFTGRGLRSFPIEHFLPADEAKARTWLAAD